MNTDVAAYYDRLAPEYDADRFGGSYGKFIDAQERRLIAAMLPRGATRILDIGCGTGRLTDFASHGCDISAQSVRLASLRHPGKSFAVADATALPYPDASFDAAQCFHLLMHLDRATVATLLVEAARVLAPGGTFVVDVASGRRRRLVRRPANGWHGATSLTRAELAALGAQAGLRLDRISGVAMTPIHRVPSAWRAALVPVDRMVCAALPDFASYLVAAFVKTGDR
ncbi:class I SAM-dependent methyltransferase [uncultured Sphingomonas sp.]|uniref:class I SAM-dependent methyltransferase n=1 Tax=uncultured Sphingomonas sp. TaxID=158754 RepID=UPI0035C9DAD8